MLNNMGLGFVISATDMASGKFRDIERRFAAMDDRITGGADRIRRAFGQIGTGISIFAAGVGTAGLGLKLANEAGKFEQSLAGVGAIAGASAADMRALHDAALEAGIATQFDPVEATAGLRALASAGLNTRESITALIPSLDLAAGSLGQLTVENAAGLATQAMKAFGIEVNDVGVAVDKMLQATNVFALEAGELPLALGVASRGSLALNQNLDETLIALGLVKNVLPSVERSATATAVAMERLADPGAQKQLQGLGVSVVDSAGKFRGFLDILGDLAPALDKMTEAKRSAFLLDVFGREALGGVNAILTQVTNGIRTQTGETVRGAAALAYLRDQFVSAGGTAASFRDKLLDTFEGQKTLLRGSVRTLAITVGEPFARVLKPVVAKVTDAINRLIGWVKGLPESTKEMIAKVVLAAGALLSAAGAAIALRGALSLVGVMGRVAGVSLGGFFLKLIPGVGLVKKLGGGVVKLGRGLGGMVKAIPGVGKIGKIVPWFGKLAGKIPGLSTALKMLKSVLGGVFGMLGSLGGPALFLGLASAAGVLGVALKKNLFGVGSSMQDVGKKVKLGFEALRQMFGQGYLSGAVQRELDRPENQKLKDFLKSIYVLGKNIGRAWEGFKGGFVKAVEGGRPVIEAFLKSLGTTGDSIAAMFGAGGKSDPAKWRAVGEAIGTFFAKMGLVTLQVLTAIIQFVPKVIGWLTENVPKLIAWFEETIPKVLSFIDSIGGVKTVLLGMAAIPFAPLATGLLSVLAAAGPVGLAIAALGAAIGGVMYMVHKAIVLADHEKAVREGIAGAKERAAALTGNFGLLVEAQQERAQAERVMTGADLKKHGILAAGAMPSTAEAEMRGAEKAAAGFVAASRAQRMMSSQPLVAAAAGGEVAVLDETLSQIRLMLSTQQSSGQPGGRGGPAAQTVVNLQVDGETIARAVAKADQDAAGRAFEPVPTY